MPLVGTVMFEGEPVRNVRVWLVVDRREVDETVAPTTPVSMETFSDPDGAFSFDAPSDRGYLVYAKADRFALAATSVSVGERHCAIDLPASTRPATFRVVDVEGRAIPRATYGLFHGRDMGLRLDSGVAGIDGTFSIQTFEDAQLSVAADGYASRALPADRDSKEIVLTVGAPIAGTVVDRRGAPVAGVFVLHDRPFSSVGVVTTDEAGRFRFEGAELQTQSVRVHRGARQLAVASIEPGDEEARIVIEESRRVSGVVVFADGRPAAGAKVGNARSDARGRFVFDAPHYLNVVTASLGTMAILPGQPATTPQWLGEAPLPTEPGATVRIELKRRYWSYVRCRLLDHAGVPIPDIMLGTAPGQKTDQEGRAVAAFAVRAGTTVHPRPSIGGFPYPFEAKTHAPLESAPEQVIRVRRPAQATLVVRVRNGDPLPPEVHARFRTTFARVLEAHRDRIVFSFDRTQKSYPRFHVSITAPGFAKWSGALPLPAEGDEVLVQIHRPAELVGRLLHEDGSAAAGWVQAWTPGVGSLGADIGADGRFELKGVPPGDCRLTFGRRDGDPLLTLERTLVTGRNELGDVRLKPMRILRGTVSGEGPLAGAIVAFPHAHHRVVTATRADGSFRLRILPGLRGEIQISKPGWASTVVSDADQQRIVLRRGGRVRLRYERGDPPNPVVSAISFGIRRPGAKTPLPVRMVAGGQRERVYADVPAGRVEVVALTMLGEHSVEVNVAVGETVDARITVP
ncbi:MAG: carboxypeptidase-like regulatory domain-containing protein [Planctomycetota bacterium]